MDGRPARLGTTGELAEELAHWFRSWVVGTRRGRRSLARHAGVATSTVYSCFEGRRVPHETTLGRILHVLDVPEPDRLRILRARQTLAARSGALLAAWPLDGTPTDTERGVDLRLRDGARLTPGGLELGGGHASTDGPVVDTTGPFTVAARVYLTDPSPYFAAAVSQDGRRLSGVSMLYSRTEGPRWCLTMHERDIPQSGRHVAVRAESAVSSPARAELWTHLAGTFSPETRAMTLYVDGRFAASAALPVPMWAAEGPFCVGRGKWDGRDHDHWPGLVRDVRAWGRCLDPAAVREAAG